MFYIGIDPGNNGAIAWKSDTTGKVGYLEYNGKDMSIMYSFLQEKFRGYKATCVIEQVGGYIGENQPGSRMFNFGFSAGIVEGFIIALGIPYKKVIPHTWQKKLGIVKRRKTEDKSEFKRRLQTEAKRTFPMLGNKVTLNRADALLITEYCYRLEIGDIA